MTDLRQRIANLSPQKRALLERYLTTKHAPMAAGQTIARRGSADPCPVSFAQQRLWFLDRLDPGSPVYTIPTAIRLTGPLHLPALEQSLNEILRRHESLRTTFPTVEGSPVQVVAPALVLPLPLVDLQGLPQTERWLEAQRRITADAQQPFDLARGPLLRALLLQLDAEECILFLSIHHIVSDGWSMGVFFGELGPLYQAFSLGNSSPLPELPIQYADFTLWRRQRLQGELLEKLLSYWRGRLAGAAPVLALPIDRPRPPLQTFRGALQSLKLSQPLTAALKELSRREGVTLFMTLLGAFQTLLHRFTGQDDLPVGTPIGIRSPVETEGLIGFFVNTLVLRTDLSGDPTFRELLGRVKEVALGAYAHQELPFERLVEELQPERSTSYSPLFQIMFTLQNAPLPPLELTGLTATPLEVQNGTAKFDLTLIMEETPEGLQAGIEYNTDLFDPPTITRLLGHLHNLLAGIAADPDQRLSSLPLLTETERQQLRIAWNDTAAAAPRANSIHELFEAQVERTPEAVAVQWEQQSLTYRELNRRTNQLAHHLQARGVGPEVLVGLCVERSLEMVVGLLGILKAGGAYLPLDPAYPRERLAFILGDAGASVVLSQQRLISALPAHGIEVVCLDADGDAVARRSEEDPAARATAKSLAYVIYTSGSTGQPKGVPIPHAAVVNFLTSMQQRPGLTKSDVLLAVTTPSFDIAVLELFLPLTVGARLVIASREAAADGAQLAQRLAASGATVMQATPATWRLLLDAGWLGDPRFKILCGGEALPSDMADLLREGGGTLWNLYGPTETTIWSSAHRVDTGADPVPIGCPIANTQLYVLDRYLQPVPIGVPGELYIGGAGLARGYLNRPELTAQAFIPDPFSVAPGQRLYRTGDMARRRAEGSLELLGRCDHQVKIRGFRIELGEIETALAQHPAIREAVVLAREDHPGEKRLVAYVVPDSVPMPPCDDLSPFLNHMLPGYMVPTVFTVLEALPRTPNGKVDRQALPAPNQVRPDLATKPTAPRDSVEIRLVKIWEQTLGVRPIGIRDNFFRLGGHSLLAARMFAQIQKAWGRNLPLVTLFQAPTVEQLAAILRQQSRPAPWSSLVVIQPNGRRPPFFCIHGIGGNVLCYHPLAHHLGPDQPVYGLQALGLDGSRASGIQVESMAARYLEELRAVQPDGPYYLGGMSFGGFVAFEMAQQLHAQGETVALLALFDTGGPGYPQWFPPAQRLCCHLENLRRRGPREKLIYARVRARAMVELLERKIWGVALKGHRGFGHALPRPLRNVAMVNLQAGREYVPRVYPGRVTLFRSMEQPVGCYDDPHSGWSDLAGGGLEVREVPGDHVTLVEEPHVQVLAEQMSDCLQVAQDARPIA